MGAGVPPPRSGSSGRQPSAALGPATGEDAATGASTHAQPEAMGLGAAPIVRLKCPLAHVSRSPEALRRRTHEVSSTGWVQESSVATSNSATTHRTDRRRPDRAQPHHGTREAGDRSNSAQILQRHAATHRGSCDLVWTTPCPDVGALLPSPRTSPSAPRSRSSLAQSLAQHPVERHRRRSAWVAAGRAQPAAGKLSPAPSGRAQAVDNSVDGG
jgi:hypothetical protein